MKRVRSIDVNVGVSKRFIGINGRVRITHRYQWLDLRFPNI